MPHFVYFLFSEAANRCYIGCSCDPMQRIEEHMLHRYDDSFTKRAEDWSLFWVSPPLAKSTDWLRNVRDIWIKQSGLADGSNKTELPSL